MHADVIVEGHPVGNGSPVGFPCQCGVALLVGKAENASGRGIPPFQTSYGTEITIKNGDYGWWMDTEQEIAELTEMIEQGQSGERTP